MSEEIDKSSENPKPIRRHDRPPLEINLGYGFGKKIGKSFPIKYKPDRDVLQQASDQGYDLRPLTEEELDVNTKRLLAGYHKLLKEMPESSQKYEEAWDKVGLERDFIFGKGDNTYRVIFGVNEHKIPYLSIIDETLASENEKAEDIGVPKQELLKEEELMGEVVLAINDENSKDLYLGCEGWNNNQEALRAANEWLHELREVK